MRGLRLATATPTPLFTSTRERRLRLWSLAVVAAVYSTLGPAGSLAARLREDNLMAAAVFALMILTVATSVPGSDQPKGSIICTPEPSKSLTLRVTRAAPRERVMAAIWQSPSPISRPAWRR